MATKITCALAMLLATASCGGTNVAPVETARPKGIEPRPGSSSEVGSGRRREGVASRAEPSREAPRRCESTGPAAVPLPERMTLGDFWQALSAQVALLDTAALQSTFQDFARRHELDPETPGLRQDFTRLWTAFEATRDGGWWRLRWSITDQEPSSIEIWKAWLRSPPEPSFAGASAVAECDEITALFSLTARHLGVRGVGLYYPTWNHVIAGWIPEALSHRKSGAVVLVPTTQIFQDCEATFDQTTFAVPKRVYEYPRRDISDRTEMAPSLAAFLLEQVRAYGEASPSLLALIRAKRAIELGSSVGPCQAYRRQLAAELPRQLTCADERALRHLARVELKVDAAGNDAVLSWLAAP